MYVQDEKRRSGADKLNRQTKEADGKLANSPVDKPIYIVISD